MKVIGGFYELLLPNGAFSFHGEALAFSNGRACVGVILKNLKIKKCYLPNFTCDAVYHPFDKENVSYDLYNINKKMEVISPPQLGEDEYFYYINYYGVKNNVVKDLYHLYGDKLIIDNTHDFFKKKQFDCWSFTSARKYFGVPDGAFLYTPLPIENSFDRFNLYSVEHNVERLKGNQSLAFQLYQKYEQSLTCEINRISIVSEKLLSYVNIELAKEKRKRNYEVLNELLGVQNLFYIEPLGADDVPFAYPFLPEVSVDKKALYPMNIFIPTLWADPLKRESTTTFERNLAENLLPLPIDERYDEEDMRFIAQQIIRILHDA